MANEPAIPTAIPPAVATGAPENPSPLTQEQHAALRKGAAAHRVIRRAATTAYFSAGSTLIVAILAVPFLVLFRDWVGGVAAMLVVGVGIVEYLGHRRFKRADRSACAMLAMNQLALLGIVGVYCAARVLTFLFSDAALVIPPETQKQLNDAGLNLDVAGIQKLLMVLILVIYSAFFVLSIFFMGGMAIYYWTRRKSIDAYHASTPGWVRRIINDVS